jgi:hypothetical protein
VTTEDDLEVRELTLNRFKRLITEVLRGHLTRNTFTPWEVEILIDLEACELEPRRRTEIFKQYQRAVERQMESGADEPMKLSQFLVLRARQSLNS